MDLEKKINPRGSFLLAKPTEDIKLVCAEESAEMRKRMNSYPEMWKRKTGLKSGGETSMRRPQPSAVAWAAAFISVCLLQSL